MSSEDDMHAAADDSVFERNLRALLTRCYAPAVADPAFRTRARTACLAAVVAARGRPARGLGSAGQPAAHGAHRSVLAWRPALAAAALLFVAVTAMLWLSADARGDGRREAILARGEVAARTGPFDRWQAFGAEADDDPENRDVAHGQLAHGALHVFTPASLGFDLGLPGLPGPAGAFIEPSSSARLALPAVGLDVELDRGGLTLTTVPTGSVWRLATSHGVLELAHGAISARVIAAPGVEPGDGVWLLLDGEASLVVRGSVQAVPSGRAMLLRHGELEPAAEGEGAASAADSSAGFVPPSVPRWPEILPTTDASTAEVAGAVPDEGLPAPRALLGRVQRDGVPVISFRLVLVPQDVPPRRDVESREVSSADGRFRWDDVPTGSYVLFVLARGAPAWSRSELEVTDTDPIAPLDVALSAEGASVAGYVTDLTTGEPIAGAVVLSETDAPARLLPMDDSPMPDFVERLCVTDETGAFLLEELSPGRQQLRVTAPGHAPGWSGGLVIAPGDHAEGVLFRLAPEARARGRVISADGTPVVGAVLIASPQPETVRPCVSYAAAITDSEGAYVLGSQPPGAGIIIMMGDESARAAGVPPQIQAASFAPGTELVIDFVASPGLSGNASVTTPAGGDGSVGCHLRGRLFGPDGAPVAQRMVTVLRQDVADADASEQWRGSMTAADGSFDFIGMQPGVWELCVGDGDGSSVSIVLAVDVPAAPEHELDVRLAGGSLAGQAVLRDTGAPVSHAMAILMRRDEASGAWGFHARQLADPSGRFHFEHLPSGRYEFTVHDLDGVLAAAPGGEVMLAPDEALAGLDVALFPGGALTVRVADARGAPVSGALVRFTDVRGKDWQFAAAPRTDPAGVQRSTGMPPGLWRVTVTGRVAGNDVLRETDVNVGVGTAGLLEVVLPDAN